MIGINLSATNILPEKHVYDRDKNSRLYHPGTFYFCAILYPIPMFTILFLIVAVSLYFINGLNNEPSTNILWGLALTVGTGMLCGLAVGSMAGVIAPDLKTVSAVVPMITLPNMLVAGSFVTVRSLTWPLFLLSYITPVRFIFQGLILLEF